MLSLHIFTVDKNKKLEMIDFRQTVLFLQWDGVSLTDVKITKFGTRTRQSATL
jgi:hypothetical protein